MQAGVLLVRWLPVAGILGALAQSRRQVEVGGRHLCSEGAQERRVPSEK